VLDPEHPGMLGLMAALAGAYYLVGKYGQAGAVFSRTLEVMRRALSPEHPSALFTLSDFASMYQRLGALAETYAAQVLAGRRDALSSENPDTMKPAADVALAYVS